MRARHALAALALAGAAFGLSACSSAPPPPVVAQAPAVVSPPTQPFVGVQSVPQISSHATSYCLLPTGSGLRVYQNGSVDSSIGSTSVVNVSNLPATNPWSCP